MNKKQVDIKRPAGQPDQAGCSEKTKSRGLCM